jgi:hypothetical protein
MHYSILFIVNISKDQSENMALNRTVRSQMAESNRGQETSALNRPSRFLLVAKYYSCDKIKEEEDETVHVAHTERKKMHRIFLCESLMNGHLKDLCIAVRTTSKHILEK